jgi:hypothetical protein
MSEDQITALERAFDHQRLQQAKNDKRLLFWCFFPGALCLGAFLAGRIIEQRFPDGDSRDFASPCLVTLTIGPGIFFGCVGIVMGIRSGNARDLFWALAWNIPLSIGPWLLLWLVIKLDLLKHV